jgi:hypothetical protein
MYGDVFRKKYNLEKHYTNTSKIKLMYTTVSNSLFN